MTPFAADPRQMLDKALKELKKQSLEIKIGAEIEFYLFKENMEFVESNSESSLSSLVAFIDDFDQLYTKLKEHDIHVEFIHKEVGNGQFELVIKYGEPFKILDDCYIAKELIL